MKPIWFHCASLGEVNSIQALLRTCPGPHILTTSSHRSRSSRSSIPASWRTSSFIKQHNPRCLVLVESELWPWMIFTAYLKGLSLACINFSMSDKSYSRWMCTSMSRALLKAMLGRFEFVHCKSLAQAGKLERLGVEPVAIGDLKFTNVEPQELMGEVKRFFEIERKRMWVAISLHPGEERVVIEARTRAKVESTLIIVPRHPTASDEVDLVEPNVYRVQAMHVVPQICRIVARSENLGFAFVGGSLSSSSHKGGHNVLEPLREGCFVAHGPHMNAFDDLLSKIPSRHRAVVDSSEELAELVASAFDAKYDSKERLERVSSTKSNQHETLLQELCKRLETLGNK